MSAPTHRLRWEPASHGSYWGYSGTRQVAMVGMVQVGDSAGRWYWQLNRIDTSWICAGRGETASAAASRRAVDHAWGRWLDRMGLQPVPATK